ncbi:unnamed protein product [Adineta ricciae]|uniref:Aspergillus nuclease S(1) n=1 Tax=Adineta ricciae TaxID=249248 RepID=A0A813TQJ5_ADIRI|nr:unnamed protein product [Adineta ricciae]
MLLLRIFLLVVSSNILHVIAWGSIGHNLVARLAQSQLNSTTNNWIQHYIASDLRGDLGRIASWPDLILYPDTNPFDYVHWLWSRDLHYINIPAWNCSYIPSRDCVNDRCIEGALKNYSRRLVDRNSDYVEQQQALIFLVHFLGDIHQPLHSGFKNDQGGNAVKGFFLNGKNLTNLHTIWDVEIIVNRIQRHFQSDVNLYYNHLLALMLNQSAMINETYNNYEEWVKESVDYVCKQVYLNDNGTRLNVSLNFTLGEEYFNRNWPTVDQRLTQAGWRLATLLNHLAEQRSSTKLPPDMQALIIMACIAIGIFILATIGFYQYKPPEIPDRSPLLAE